MMNKVLQSYEDGTEFKVKHLLAAGAAGLIGTACVFAVSEGVNKIRDRVRDHRHQDVIETTCTEV